MQRELSLWDNQDSIDLKEAVLKMILELTAKETHHLEEAVKKENG